MRWCNTDLSLTIGIHKLICKPWAELIVLDWRSGCTSSGSSPRTASRSICSIVLPRCSVWMSWLISRVGSSSRKVRVIVCADGHVAKGINTRLKDMLVWLNVKDGPKRISDERVSSSSESDASEHAGEMRSRAHLHAVLAGDYTAIPCPKEKAWTHIPSPVGNSFSCDLDLRWSAWGRGWKRLCLLETSSLIQVWGIGRKSQAFGTAVIRARWVGACQRWYDEHQAARRLSNRENIN